MSDIRLVGVTKTVSTDRIKDAISLGLKDLGENKVQEALAKLPVLADTIKKESVRLHFIGHLQSNKARKAIENFDVIQSVDRPSLAEALDRISSEMGKKTACLVEVKISDEQTKSGVPLAQTADFIASFSAYKNLSLEGLMTIGALDVSADQTRQGFRTMNDLFQRHRGAFSVDKPILSMGMSDDFEMAIEEGSTMVRVGRSLFGERV